MTTSTMLIDHVEEDSPSVLHKLERIKDQEIFRTDHLVQFNSLTKRELEVITLIVIGYKNPQIAHLLCISRNTVEQHRKNINRKLKIKSISVLFQYALAFDLV